MHDLFKLEWSRGALQPQSPRAGSSHASCTGPYSPAGL